MTGLGETGKTGGDYGGGGRGEGDRWRGRGDREDHVPICCPSLLYMYALLNFGILNMFS